MCRRHSFRLSVAALQRPYVSGVRRASAPVPANSELPWWFTEAFSFGSRAQAPFDIVRLGACEITTPCTSCFMTILRRLHSGNPRMGCGISIGNGRGCGKCC